MALDRLYTVKDICERYDCNRNTAAKYIRQMRHMENPLRAYESEVRAWESSRTVESSDVIKARAEAERQKRLALAKETRRKVRAEAMLRQQAAT